MGLFSKKKTKTKKNDGQKSNQPVKGVTSSQETDSHNGGCWRRRGGALSNTPNSCNTMIQHTASVHEPTHDKANEQFPAANTFIAQQLGQLRHSERD